MSLSLSIYNIYCVSFAFLLQLQLFVYLSAVYYTEIFKFIHIRGFLLCFPGGSMVKNLPVMHEIQVWSPGWGRPLREEYDNPLQDSCLGNSMDRGAWWATVHSVAKELHRTKWLNNKWKVDTSAAAQHCEWTKFHWIVHFKMVTWITAIKIKIGTSLVVQWLRLRAPNARGSRFNPWSGNWIPYAATKTSHTTTKDSVCHN